MQIEYCGKCGVRLDGKELDNARASRSPETLCEKCRSQASTTQNSAHKSNRMISPSLPRPAGAHRSSTRTAISGTPSHGAHKPARSPSMAIVTTAVVIGMLGLAMAIAARPSAPTSAAKAPPPSTTPVSEKEDREALAAKELERLVRFEGINADDQEGRIRSVEGFLRSYDGTQATRRAETLLAELKNAQSPPLSPKATTNVPPGTPQTAMSPPASPPAADTLSVTRLTLIDAKANKPVEGYDPLKDGSVVSLKAIGTDQITIQAHVKGPVHSVVFGVDDNPRKHTEGGAPWSLSGNQNNDFKTWKVSPGKHTVTATPYRGDKGTGQPGTPTTVTITIEP